MSVCKLMLTKYGLNLKRSLSQSSCEPNKLQALEIEKIWQEMS